MTTWSAPTPSSRPAATPRWSASTAPARRSPSPPTAPRAIATPTRVEGGKQAIAEAWRNLCAVGATPARRHRLPEFRQPAAARDHGPVRRLHRGHGRGLPGARLPDRLAATSPSTTRPRPRTAPASAILPTPAIGGVGLLEDWRKAVGIALQGAGRRHRHDRRPPRPSRPVALAARDPRPRGGRPAAAVDLPPSAPPASSSAPRSPAARSPPATTSPTAASPSRSPKWRWPAISAR